MDTLPFHTFLLVLDSVVLFGLYFWLRFRSNRNSSVLPHTVPLELALFQHSPVRRKPSLVWDFFGTAFFGGVWLLCFAILSRLIFMDYFQEHIFHFNVGQCIVEGIAVHGTLMLFFSAVLLYRNRRFLPAGTMLLTAVVLAGFSFDILYWEPYRLKVELYEIKTAKIKRKLRVVFVSDVQTDHIGWHEERMLQKIQQQKADLIIFGGDYLQTYRGTLGAADLPEKFRQLFAKYSLKAPLGVFAIAGNIGPTNQTLFADTGVETVTASTIFDNLGTDKNIGPIDLVLLGLNDSSGGIGERGLTDSGNFIIMAGHYPNYAINGFKYKQRPRSIGYKEMERAPDLMLAGHTHGGQISLPWDEPLFSEGGDKHAFQIPRDMWKGFFTYPNGGHLLITRGVGMERGWAPRVRFLCPSEISVIDIIPE